LHRNNEKTMKKSITYNYSTTAIIERSRAIIALTKEDLKDLAKFGASQKDIDALEKRLAEFKKFPDDKHFAEKVKEKTLQKYEAEEKLITMVRNFFLHFSIIVPSKKESKKYFPSQKLTGIKTKELIAIAEKVILVGKRFKEKLATYNMSDSYLDDLKTNITSAKKTLKSLDQVRLERLKNTNKRRDLGAILYEQIVKLCHYGKTYWKERDAERYKKYLLYVKNDDKNQDDI
jgi:hypothetical protein